ncbi:MAG: hypothetical protein IJ769_04950 [Clostridia bacterium]|nr:hypothetical protein [Clostridia bacterium]
MDRVNSVAELIERTKDMPLEKMRFFINQDRKEPRCFGIYQDSYTGHWVVYKNKDNGSRAVRYSGPDEAFAAQELWAKINSEIELRRAKLPRQRTRAERVRDAVKRALLIALIAAASFIFLRWYIRSPVRGYYLIDDGLYYYQNSDWYYYDDGDWEYYDEPVDYDWYHGNYSGKTYDGFEDYDDAFERSDYYVEPSSGDHDSNSSVFSSWDSADTDWSSDW